MRWTGALAKVRRDVVARDGYCCRYCGITCGGRTHALTLDHVTPRSKGGASTVANVVVACASCNSVKGEQDVTYLRDDLQRRGLLWHYVP